MSTVMKTLLQFAVVLSLQCLIGIEGACSNVGPTDIVFVVDSSGSICDNEPGYEYGRDKTCNNWKSVVNFMTGIVNRLKIGPADVMVGLVVFQNDARVAWTLDSYPTKAELIGAISNLPYEGGNTATTLGLRAMTTQVFGLSGDRSNAANVAIIITDGNPTILVNELDSEVQKALNQGITMVAVGVTKEINENVLKTLSSPPQQLNTNYFMSSDFQSINSISQKLEISTFCPSEASRLDQTEPCTTTSAVADITFVVDTSGSICDTDEHFQFGIDQNCENFDKLKTFLKDIVSSLNVGANANRVALVIFRTEAYVAWPLDKYFDSSSLVNAIDQLSYEPGGHTATTDGLLKMRTEVFGQPGDRQDIPNKAVIITDGRPNIRETDLLAEVARCQTAGITMVAIGVTKSIDEDTLKKLPSPPQQKDVNYFMSADYKSIDTIKKGLEAQVLCSKSNTA